MQAAIAAVHAEAPSAADTDWREIVGLYDLLLRITPSPIVALNRTVALAMRDGPEAGLAALDELLGEGVLDGYQLAMPPAPTSAAAWDVMSRRARHTSGPSSSLPRPPPGDSWRNGSPHCPSDRLLQTLSKISGAVRPIHEPTRNRVPPSRRPS